MKIKDVMAEYVFKPSLMFSSSWAGDRSCPKPSMGPHSLAVPYPQEFLTGEEYRAVTAALILHLQTLVLPFPNINFLKNLPAAIHSSRASASPGEEDKGMESWERSHEDG